MKKKTIPLFTFTFILHLLLAANAAEYTLSGTRYLRKYTAPQKSQVYMTETDVQRIANKMCEVPWEKSELTLATATTHVTTNLDQNVVMRESFDAALFCANHASDEHVAYANAACYVFEFPQGASLPMLTNLEMTVYSDPYNAYGARISVMASDRLEIPTDCATVRGDATGGIKATGVCTRVTRRSGNSSTWYPATTNVVFSSGFGCLGVSGLQLKRYLFVFVLMENYATSRGNWIEGCSWIENEIRIKTSSTIQEFEKTETCDIVEPYATKYHLKDGHADEDWDGDGLSNYAEYLISKVFKFADLDPDNPKTNGSVVDYFRNVGDLYLGELFAGFKSPQSERTSVSNTLYATVSYHGRRRSHASVVVKCWMVSRDPEMYGEADETFVSGAFAVNGTHAVKLLRDASKSLETPLKGACKWVAFADEDGSGDFTEGEPFCYWEADATPHHAITLSDESPVFQRVSLKEGGSCKTRVRVVRTLVDGSNKLGVDENGHDVTVKRVVLDKYLDLGTRSYLHEGDFLTGGAYDCDWNTFQSDIVNATAYASQGTIGEPLFIDATNVTYAIVLGEGVIGTSNTYRTVEKTFDKQIERDTPITESYQKRVVLAATQPKKIVYGARPTFRFAMADGNGNRYGGYTAFRIRIDNWTSELNPLPARNAEGWHEWKTDRPLESFINANTTYGAHTWSVAMYNQKFQSNRYDDLYCNEWSANGTFVYNANNQQPMNDHGYSTIAATVKYAGFEDVGSYPNYTNHITNTRKCIVQAFRTCDYYGVPEGQAYAVSDIFETSKIAANAHIRGIPQDGTYYLRAFIDENGNGKKDDFEPWGEAKEPVTISKATRTMPVVGIWIEDVDTDGDWLPDAWEYLTYGSLTEQGANIIGGDSIIFSGAVSVAGNAGISTGIGGASLTIFQNQSFIRSKIGLTDVVSIDDVRAYVNKSNSPSAFKITALTLAPDGHSVTLSVTPDVSLSIAGETLGQYVNIASGDTATVRLKVYKKETLATASWTLVWTTGDITVSRYATEITSGPSVVKGIDMTSGFYKIEVVQ